ncbi:MAG: hypothetical protein NC133_02845 [Prevotella sp.]|nr:hypothetical protein [Prevotella sp.]
MKKVNHVGQKIKRSWLVLCAIVVLSTTMLAGCNSRDSYGSAFPVSTNHSNFNSQSTVTYDHINGQTVTVDLFHRTNGEALNNPNVGQGILIYQCIQYKQAHPDQTVTITCTSFHFSVVAAVCVNPESKFYGYMKSLYDVDYDEEGFVRMAYLLVYAAKIGINVIVIGQIDANPVDYHGQSKDDESFVEYFTQHLADDSTIDGKKVGDFMLFREAKWTSYGDKSASDMLHVKSCTVSHYLDSQGVEHGGSVWLSSTNIDGIHSSGANGNDGIQTGVILSDHQKIRDVIYNYTRMMADYCEQEAINLFRDKVIKLNTEQIDLINAGRENEIPTDEQIVYLGSATDQVFEMYFAPFGGTAGSWDTVHNPYCKYLSKLLPSVSGDGYITLAWNNVKYLTNFEFSKTLATVIQTAFTTNSRLTNKLYLHLPGFPTELLDGLVAGQNIGTKCVNQNLDVYYHSKDLQLSYFDSQTRERHYVTMLNSLNFHQGSMSYQTNTLLVIKETRATGNDVYVNFGQATTNGVISELDRIVKVSAGQ